MLAWQKTRLSLPSQQGNAPGRVGCRGVTPQWRHVPAWVQRRTDPMTAHWLIRKALSDYRGAYTVDHTGYLLIVESIDAV